MKSNLIILILNHIIFLWSLVGLCSSQISTNQTDVNSDLSLLETEQISKGEFVILAIGITWNNSKGALLANQCDFIDNDISSIGSKSQDCPGIC